MTKDRIIDIINTLPQHTIYFPDDEAINDHWALINADDPFEPPFQKDLWYLNKALRDDDDYMFCLESSGRTEEDCAIRNYYFKNFIVTLQA